MGKSTPYCAREGCYVMTPRHLCYFHTRTEQMIASGACLNCARPFDPPRFPLARPRMDGTRAHHHYCDECLDRIQGTRTGNRDSHRRANRLYKARMAA